MTTVVNNPTPSADSGGNSFLIGIILFIGLVVMLIYFGLPIIQRMGPVQVTMPAPEVVVPEKIDVNVIQGQ